MLLKDYMRSLGVVGFGANSTEPGSLRVVGRFEFGQLYRIVLLSGATVEFGDFTTMLDTLRDEFRASPTYDMRVGLKGLTRSKAVLAVEPENVMGRPWGRNVRKTLDNITLWVTEYNLNDGWGPDVPELPAGKGSPWT